MPNFPQYQTNINYCGCFVMDMWLWCRISIYISEISKTYMGIIQYQNYDIWLKSIMFTFWPKITKIGSKWSDIDFFSKHHTSSISQYKNLNPIETKKYKNNQYPPHSICAAFLIFKVEKINKKDNFFCHNN